MKILIAHNRYQQAGGEDAVVQTEYDILKKYGEDVFLYERNNAELKTYSPLKKINFLLSLSWSKKSYQDFRSAIRKYSPDIVHFHNIFYMMTPAVYDACRDKHVPVVQSQHNFRPLCSNGLFFRDNHVCEECLHHSLWRGVRHRCYHNSYIQSFFIARMLQIQKQNQTWHKKIDRYIMASEFTKQKYVEAGISAEKISIKPHALLQSPNPSRHPSDYALFVGRLSTEKGIEVLLKAWEPVQNTKLKIMGNGPLLNSLQDYIRNKKITNVEFLGFRSQEDYEKDMQGAKFLIVPSTCYENFPRIFSEAYARGIPIIASRLGSMQHLVVEGKTGLTFEAGNHEDLTTKIRWAMDHPKELEQTSREAHRVFEEQYTAPKNYALLMDIYQKTLHTS